MLRVTPFFCVIWQMKKVFGKTAPATQPCVCVFEPINVWANQLVVPEPTCGTTVQENYWEML